MTNRRSFLRMLGLAPVAAPLMVAAAKAAPAVTPNEYLKTVVADGPPIWDMRIDAHGASPEVVERLGRTIAEQKRSLPNQVIKTVESAKKVGKPLSTAQLDAVQSHRLVERDALIFSFPTKRL